MTYEVSCMRASDLKVGDRVRIGAAPRDKLQGLRNAESLRTFEIIDVLNEAPDLVRLTVRELKDGSGSGGRERAGDEAAEPQKLTLPGWQWVVLYRRPPKRKSRHRADKQREFLSGGGPQSRASAGSTSLFYSAYLLLESSNADRVHGECDALAGLAVLANAMDAYVTEFIVGTSIRHPANLDVSNGRNPITLDHSLKVKYYLFPQAAYGVALPPHTDLATFLDLRDEIVHHWPRRIETASFEGLRKAGLLREADGIHSLCSYALLKWAWEAVDEALTAFERGLLASPRFSEAFSMGDPDLAFRPYRLHRQIGSYSRLRPQPN